MKLAAIAAAAALFAVAAQASQGSGGVAMCKGSQLSATFRVIPGSAGAGNIVYLLRVTNHGASTCAVTGLPHVQLYTKSGTKNPTRVRAAFPGALTAVLVRLAPGGSAKARARFSPDVPGVGEPTAGTNCEPVSYWLKVYANGSWSARTRVRPATPACEHGQLQFDAYGPAS